MEFVILTGMSGAGKTLAAKFLEDMGYFCVDNLPVFLLPKFGELCEGSELKSGRFALVLDVRGGDFVDELLAFTDHLRSLGALVRIVFLDCADNVIISRHSENKKLHPLATDGDNVSAVIRERRVLEPLGERADYIIDTTQLTGWELKTKLRAIFGQEDERGNMAVNIVSFGYRNSLPENADVVFDVRFLENPYYVPELRMLTGNDAAVRDYVFEDGNAADFIEKITELLKKLIPLYIKEGKQVLTVAIGCTGGRHRSVAVANELTAALAESGVNVSLTHRDIGR